MGGTQRPLLLIDVDGVLNPLVPGLRSGFVSYVLLGYDVQLSRLHGRWLSGLGDVFDLTWATTWEHDADRIIAPLIDLPSGLPVIEFRSQSPGQTWKLTDVETYVEDRPFAWIDDDLGPDAFEWAERRESPTLLIRVDPTVGLVEEHIDRLRSFGEGVLAEG